MLTMFSYDRIVGIIYRHLYLQVRDLMRLFDITYWPLLDLIVWGFGNIALASAGADPSWAIANVICVLFWQVAYRANLEISTNLLEEIWERNLMNLFSTPLKFGEWVIGLLALSIVRIMIMLCICIIAMYYAFSIFLFSIFFIFHFCMLAINWWMGNWLFERITSSLFWAKSTVFTVDVCLVMGAILWHILSRGSAALLDAKSECLDAVDLYFSVHKKFYSNRRCSVFR